VIFCLVKAINTISEKLTPKHEEEEAAATAEK